MGQVNTSEEKINNVSGAAGQVKVSQGANLIPVWGLPRWTLGKLLKGAGTGADPTEIDPPYGVMDFWSDMQEEVVVTGAQTTPGLPSVTVAGLPGTATVIRAIAMFKFRMVENTFAGANALDAAAPLPIQVNDSVPTGWVTAIDFVDDAFTLGASTREGGDVIIGDNNISARVDGNDTYPFQWLDAKADQNNLQFNDVQVGLRVWYGA